MVQKVSIIITTHNCAADLEMSLQSIERQTYPSIEVVIQDGLSSDNTVEVALKYKALSRYEFIIATESDFGIYDAMNKGYRKSTGDIVAFCSDQLSNSMVVKTMIDAIERAGEACLGGHADLVYISELKVIRYWKMGEGRISQGWMPGHPTLYLKRSVYEKYGLYNSTFNIAADYDFMIRVLKDREDLLTYVPQITVLMFYGGTSTKGTKSYFESLSEANKVLKMNHVKYRMKVNVVRTFRVIWQFVLAKLKRRKIAGCIH